MIKNFAKCKACQGAGEHLDPHYSGNPALETSSYCSDCAGTGRVRIGPVDPIEQLASARKRRYTSPFYAQRYGEIRQRVVSPVMLP